MTFAEPPDRPAPPWNEAGRLAALDRYAVLDTPREPEFDDIVRLAADIFEAPIAVVNLIASGRQWFKAEVGIGADELPLDVSICAHAILQPGIFVVPDTTADHRFRANPLVTGAPGLRFYAGALLETPDGLPLGTVCVLDTAPRPDGITDRQRLTLEVLARQAMAQLELRRAVTARDEHIARAQRSEQAERASEARYRMLFEAIDAGFCLVEVRFDAPDGRIDYRVVEANPAFYRQTGFPEAILGQWLRAAAPELEEHWYEVYGRVARTGAPERFEQGSDHLGRWFDVHAFRTGDPDEHRVAILFNDISARRLAEDQLRKLNATLEAEVETRTAERDRMWTNSRDLMAVTDTSGVFRRVNPAWTRLLGWRADQLVGHSYLEFIHPDDHGSSRGALATASRDALPLYENRYRHRNGSYRWVSWLAVPEGDRIYAYGRDVTAEKARQAKLRAAEAARREADALYRAYFEHTAEALFVVDVLDDGGFAIADLNPAHQASIGLPLAEVKGRRIDAVLPPELAGAVEAHYRHVLEIGAVYQYRETFELHGAATYWDTVLVPVRGTDGRIVRLIGSSRDLTAQRAAEEALRQSQKMEAMGQLTGGVAHDFNNLLTPIIGSLDLLQRKRLGGEREARMIDGALQSAERAKTLVQRLLAFARRQPLQPVAVDVAALVTGMADLVASTTGPQVKVIVEAPADLPQALADPNQLEMALLNLCVNARDAMPDGGTLRISAGADEVGSGHRSGVVPGRYIRLSVADTGVGMDADTARRAIEPFFSTKGIGKGTGLGLSMVHGLASQLGGGLAIASERGLGTNVELWLPVSDAGAPAAAGARGAPAATAGAGTALLVDDEEVVRLSTADMLADLGYAVVEAASGEAALRLLDGGLRPDLLVTDHLMPGLSGSDLALEARRRWPTLPILLVSGYAEIDGVAPDLARLSKPFRQADLAACLAELGTRAPRARARSPTDRRP
jgi:PAS domain S-box-containing protein